MLFARLIQAGRRELNQLNIPAKRIATNTIPIAIPDIELLSILFSEIATTTVGGGTVGKEVAVAVGKSSVGVDISAVGVTGLGGASFRTRSLSP